MPPSIPFKHIVANPKRGSIPGGWRQPLVALGVSWIGLFALFHQDWTTMAALWWNVSTYNFILFIPLILAWLVQQRATELAHIVPSTWWPGLLVAGGAAATWLLGMLAGFDLVRQLGAVGLLIAAVPLLLGPRASWALMFPLCYALLLVPLGDEFVPALQLMTAKIAVWLVHVTGVDAQIDGVFIRTPAGLFEVAEACSGVKFLVAMLAFGFLVANLCFESLKKRTIFLLACLVVPILANGARAWATIFVAQIVGADAAVGFDHLVYGWFFFALVAGSLCAAAWPFFDRDADARWIDGVVIQNDPMLGRLASLEVKRSAAVALFAAIALGVDGWAKAASAMEEELPRQVFLPEVHGWDRIDYAPSIWWQPVAAGADHRLLGSYSDEQGHKVDVFIAIYSSQEAGRAAGSYGNGALTPGSEWNWLAPGPSFKLAKSERLLARGEIERLAVTTYSVGPVETGSELRLMFERVSNALLLHPAATSMLIVSAEEGGAARASDSIIAFRNSVGPAGDWIDRLPAVR